MENLSLISRGKIGGKFELECWRPDDPALAHRIKARYGVKSPEYRAIPRHLAFKEEFHNVWTDEGLNKLLNIMFNAATQITTWYCTIFENDFTPDGDETYAVPAYTESIAYDEATRPEYVEAASSAKSTTNSANKAVFTINATKTIYGAALVGGGTNPTGKNDKTSGGTLACAGRFASSRAVVDDDVINLTYTVSAADDGV